MEIKSFTSAAYFKPSTEETDLYKEVRAQQNQNLSAVPTGITVTHYNPAEDHSFEDHAKMRLVAGGITQNLENEMIQFYKEVSTERPNLLYKSWDFVTENGQLRVTSDQLSQFETKWLEEKLNSKTNIKNLSEDYNAIVADYFSNWGEQSIFDLTTRSYGELHGKVDGQVNFRDMLSRIDEMRYTLPGERNAGRYAPTTSGSPHDFYAIEVAMFYLTPEHIKTSA